MLEHGPNQIPNTLTSSQEVFHVKTFHTPEKVQDCKASEAASSLKSAALLATWDQDSLSWKTSQRCLLEDWETFSGHWPRSGTMRNGIAYRLRPLVPRISGTGFSLLPTPTVGDSKNARNATAKRKPGGKHNSGVTPCDYVTMWPTPRATDGNKGCRTIQGATKELKRGKNIDLTVAVVCQNGTSGKLNPEWVEWLMGFPAGWTDCEDSETQSCRKSQNTSDAAS